MGIFSYTEQRRTNRLLEGKTKNNQGIALFVMLLVVVALVMMAVSAIASLF